jgi:hypothetical protein
MQLASEEAERLPACDHRSGSKKLRGRDEGVKGAFIEMSLEHEENEELDCGCGELSKSMPLSR